MMKRSKFPVSTWGLKLRGWEQTSEAKNKINSFFLTIFNDFIIINSGMELFLLFLFLFSSIKEQGRPTAPTTYGTQGSTLSKVNRGTPTATPTFAFAATSVTRRRQSCCLRYNWRSSQRYANARRGEGRGERDARCGLFATLLSSRGSRRGPRMPELRGSRVSRGSRRGWRRGVRLTATTSAFNRGCNAAHHNNSDPELDNVPDIVSTSEVSMVSTDVSTTQDNIFDVGFWKMFGVSKRNFCSSKMIFQTLCKLMKNHVKCSWCLWGRGAGGGNLAGGRCLTLWGILTPAPTPDPLVGNNPFIFPDSKLYRLVVRYNFLQTFSVKGKLRKIFKIFEGWGLGGWSLEPLLGLGGP